jgi:TPR repeat protein
MMLNGRGGRRSPEGALEQFKLAADQGHSGAMFALGAIFAGGHGLPTDLPLARHWFSLAANGGHPEAQRSLERIAMDEADNQEEREGNLDCLAKASAP